MSFRMPASRRAGSVTALSRCPPETRSLIPQSPIPKIANGVRFVTVPLSFVPYPDLSFSCPLFIHMHSSLRVTHYMYLLLSQCLRLLVVRLLISFAHSRRMSCRLKIPSECELA